MAPSSRQEQQAVGNDTYLERSFVPAEVGADDVVALVGVDRLFAGESSLGYTPPTQVTHRELW